jgi:UDP-N-acetylmuramate--alanine ligase
MKHAIKRIHFVGIGGAGMSGIAEVLHQLGYRVSGSDLADTAVSRRLSQLGMPIFVGHAAAHVGEAQVVVTSSAVKPDNPEVVAAAARRIPVVGRAVLLAELLRLKRGIAIAGTHGKTTTTTLVARVLAEAGLDPSFVIGGTPLASALPPDERAETRAAAAAGQPASAARRSEEQEIAGANSHLGSGDHIVVEADESDASFLFLSPVISVVTNIDADHMETYGHELSRLHDAFVDFIHRLPFYGRAVMCSDDAGVRAVMPRLQRPTTAYGLAEGADLRAVGVQALPGGQMRFVAQQQGRPDLPLLLNLAGEHNVRNGLAALAVARELDLPDEPVARALATFGGVGRRFQRCGELPTRDGGHCTLIDDYGHHPAELAAVIAAARGAFPGRRLVLVFQPHRYTRTRDCFADFVDVLGRADVLLLTEVYAAGEAAIPGCDGAALARAVAAAGAVVPLFVAGVAALPLALAGSTRDGDVVITMGAGSIGTLPRLLLPKQPAEAVA